MKLFYKNFDASQSNKRFYYKFYRVGKDLASAWYRRHTKILIHSGLGGKNHLLERGHTQWNRKGRW